MGAGLYVPPDGAWLTAFETSGPMMAQIAIEIPTIGLHEMRRPMRRRRSPVFVRSICLRRSASQADGRPGIAPGYAPGAAYIGGAAVGAGVPADRGLPQFVQNIVPSLFEVPQRGQVRLVANFPLRHPEQNRG